MQPIHIPKTFQHIFYILQVNLFLYPSWKTVIRMLVTQGKYLRTFRSDITKHLFNEMRVSFTLKLLPC